MVTPPAASAEDTGKGSLESCCLAKKSCRNDRLAYAQILPAVNVSPGNSVHIGVVSAFWRAAAKETDDRGSALVAPQRKRERAADREQQQDEAGDRHRTQSQAAALAALDAAVRLAKRTAVSTGPIVTKLDRMLGATCIERECGEEIVIVAQRPRR